MRNRLVEGAQSKNKNKGWFFAFYQQWSALFSASEQNWVDFTVFELTGEWADYSGRCELTLAILGFRFTVTYVFNSEFNDLLLSRREEIERELLARTGATEVKDPFNSLDRVDSK